VEVQTSWREKSVLHTANKLLAFNGGCWRLLPIMMNSLAASQSLCSGGRWRESETSDGVENNDIKAT